MVVPAPGSERWPPVPGYRLVDLLGEGGQGRVFSATRDGDGFAVAVKTLTPRLSAAELDSYARRFRREIDVSKAFAHPNLLRVLDGGRTADGTLFLVTELLEGETLAELAVEQPVPPHLVLDVARQVAEAFACYHPRGLVHRDIKPSNIFVERSGRVVLIDFGLVHGEDMTRITSTQEIPGTVPCMAPEQLRGAPLTPRTDVYQLGAALYYALVGAWPRTQEEHPRT